MGRNTVSENLASALVEYQEDFEARLRQAPNQTANDARERIAKARHLVDSSGLGRALMTLLEHVKYWPSWSKREDFKAAVGFPVEDVIANETTEDKSYRPTKTSIVCFIYQGSRYALVFKDEGSMSMPDGESYHSGKVQFVAGDDIVLGLEISLDYGEYVSTWDYHGVNALKMGPWAKALLEIAAYIKMHEDNASARRHDERDIEQARGIDI